MMEGVSDTVSFADPPNSFDNERYQYLRASHGLRRRCLLFRPKGRGISPCFPGTRSGEEPSCWFLSSRSVGEWKRHWI